MARLQKNRVGLYVTIFYKAKKPHKRISTSIPRSDGNLCHKI
jgi:hypothetical protein